MNKLYMSSCDSDVVKRFFFGFWNEMESDARQNMVQIRNGKWTFKEIEV